MYGMVSSHSGARARIKHKTFSQQQSTEQQAGSSAKKPARNIFQRFYAFLKDAWYGITDSNGKSISINFHRFFFRCIKTELPTFYFFDNICHQTF